LNTSENLSKIEYLRNFYTQEQIDYYCEESTAKLNQLWESAQPEETCITNLKSINEGDIVYVDSPDGWVLAEQWRNKGPKECFRIAMENGVDIGASHDHLFQRTNSEWVYARDLIVGDKLLSDSGCAIINTIIPVGTKVVYDLAIDHQNHRYFTNGISSHNSGKSLFLQNLARKWALDGKNVIYISLELSEDLVNLRLDSMITNKGTAYVRKNIDAVALHVLNLRRKGAGDLKVKKLPEAGTTCNTIRAYLKEYEIQEGKKPDVLIIDYLDLMHPNNSKIDVANLFTKDKHVSEEMRAIGTDWDIPVVSASQLNRSSVEAQEFDHSHIAGGISKINTADNVFGIFTSMTMKDRGVYQLQFLKTRSAAATGMKIELRYDPISMEIEDPENTEDDEILRSTPLDDIKKQFQNQPTTSRGPIMSEPKTLTEGMKISELATPQSAPLRNSLTDLIRKNRSDEK